MLIVGVSWVLFWALVQVFTVKVLTAALTTGIVFILLGLILGEVGTHSAWPWRRTP